MEQGFELRSLFNTEVVNKLAKQVFKLIQKQIGSG